MATNVKTELPNFQRISIRTYHFLDKVSRQDSVPRTCSLITRLSLAELAATSTEVHFKKFHYNLSWAEQKKENEEEEEETPHSSFVIYKQLDKKTRNKKISRKPENTLFKSTEVIITLCAIQQQKTKILGSYFSRHANF